MTPGAVQSRRCAGGGDHDVSLSLVVATLSRLLRVVTTTTVATRWRRSAAPPTDRRSRSARSPTPRRLTARRSTPPRREPASSASACARPASTRRSASTAATVREADLDPVSLHAALHGPRRRNGAGGRPSSICAGWGPAPQLVSATLRVPDDVNGWRQLRPERSTSVGVDQATTTLRGSASPCSTARWPAGSPSPTAPATPPPVSSTCAPIAAETASSSALRARTGGEETPETTDDHPSCRAARVLGAPTFARQTPGCTRHSDAERSGEPGGRRPRRRRCRRRGRA